MGETQLYSQRLHGITEKRRILSEVDRVQRELEQQKVKLHQLKRKSLRDRWLMDGLVPTAGAELENPLSETEGEIKQLELQLESLQSELLYLENPELRALKGVKVQGVTLQKELVNGERNLQQVDQNENLKEHPIAEEADQPGDSQGEKPAGSQKDLTSSTEVVNEHPIPAPRRKNLPENHEVEHKLDLQLSDTYKPDDKESHQSQNVDGSVPINGDGDHKSHSENNEIQNSGHNEELQDTKEEHLAQDGNPQELSMDEDNVDKVQSVPNQNLGSLEKTLEEEDQNLRVPSGSVGQKTDDSQPSSGHEDLNNDSFKQNQNENESLLDEITKLVNLREQEGNQQNQGGDKPHLSTEQLIPESLLIHNNEENSQNLEKNKVSVLISHEQGHTPDEELVLSLETERAHPVLSNSQEEKEKSVTVYVENETPDSFNQVSPLSSEDQTPDSSNLPLENAQKSVLPPSEQEVCTSLPCTDQVSSQLPLSGGQNQDDQVQICQVLVISPSEHEQHTSNSAQGPSAYQKPGAIEPSTAPESQPLLKKPQETDAHLGANTAETRDKSTPTKKKTCQCCVLM